MLRRIRIMIMNHFGFSIQEANGTLVLIIILSLYIFIPPLYKSFAATKQTSFKSDAADILKWKKEFDIVKKEPIHKKELLKIPESSFDPNQLSVEEWIEFGINASVAQRITKYIKAGGSFKKKEDVLKIYGIDSSATTFLFPFMKIHDEAVTNSKPSAYKLKEPLKEDIEEIIKLNINAANVKDLRSIYGIGEKLSKRIISYRSALGGYYSISQLAEVYYLEDSLLPKIEKVFEFDTEMITPLLINSDSTDQLKRHPYLNYNLAKAIVSYREVHGRFESPDDLLAIKIISDSTFQKLKPYISVKD